MSSSANFRKARAAARKYAKIQKVGDLQAAKREAWRTILIVRDNLLTFQNDPDIVSKLSHAMATSLGIFNKLHEATEVENRLREIEERLNISAVAPYRLAA